MPSILQNKSLDSTMLFFFKGFFSTTVNLSNRAKQSKVLTKIPILSILTVLSISIVISSCDDQFFFLSEEEKSAMRTHQGFLDKEHWMMRVKNTSKDLEICSIRNKLNFVTDEIMQTISSGDFQRKNFQRNIQELPCFNILETLAHDANQALDQKAKAKEIYNLIVTGRHLARENSTSE